MAAAENLSRFAHSHPVGKHIRNGLEEILAKFLERMFRIRNFFPVEMKQFYSQPQNIF